MKFKDRTVFPSIQISTLTSTLKSVMVRFSLGLVYLWFGGLKFFPKLSPAEAIAGNTIEILTLGYVSPEIGIPLLAFLEIGIGLAFIFGLKLKILFPVFICHMLGTFTPLIIFSDEVFSSSTVGLTLLGQYIVKNVVLMAAGFSLLNSRSS